MKVSLHEIRKRIVGDTAMRMWTVIAGLVGVIGLIVTISPIEREPTPSLQLRRFEVHDPRSTDAVLTDPTRSQPDEHIEIDSNALDISVFNSGDQAALVTEIEVRVLYAAPLQDCALMQGGGGDLMVEAHYDLKIPNQLPELPHRLTKPVSFEVNPRENGRFAITLGPEHDGPIPSVYVLDVALVHDGQKSPLPVGKAAVLDSPGDGGLLQFDAAVDRGDYDCFEENLDILEGADEFDAKPSRDLQQLRSHVKRLVNEYPSQRGTPACTGPSSPPLTQACFTFSGREVAFEVKLSAPATPNNTQVYIRLTGKELDSGIVWAASYGQGRWDAGDPQFYNPEDRFVASECESCLVSGDERRVVAFSPRTSLLATREVEVVVELRSLTTSGSWRTVAASAPFVATRG
ncbi:hypothetical protein [Actinophytocola xanthii]|uniref:hypothetical protein n=1 Tax=Actinophytocola xanthii TaxID=1912961 RepID=UPI0011779139|nr:hypothetical protein [Actinophytocola xanthii]